MATPLKHAEGLRNLALLLPSLLSLKQKAGTKTPMSLLNHFPFEPVFSLDLPTRFTLRAARQVGKTRSYIGRAVIQAAMAPGHETIVVLPLQEQSDRLSATVCKPFIEDSPIRCLLRSDSLQGSVRRRAFDNRACIHFTYASLDADRARSLSGSWLMADEAQDLDGDEMPVLAACLDAADEPVTWVAGTSKTNATYLEVCYADSSQAFWHTRCTACGFDNVACLETSGGHLLAMIGPERDDVSEQHPGVRCKGCLGEINPRWGRWVHRYPERARDSAGYHIPQVIVPVHYANPAKWSILHSRMRGENNYSTQRLYNEVFGEPNDDAVQLVGVEDLKRAATLEPNDALRASSYAQRYGAVMLGVDWGGGGDDGVSRTKVAGVGLKPDGTAEVFYGAALPPTMDRIAEAREVRAAAILCRAKFIAHDVNGGQPSEAALVHLGWPTSQIVPITYQAVTAGDMVVFHPASHNRLRGFYTTDKTLSLGFLSQAIRSGRVRFFAYDYRGTADRGLLHDFLALMETKVETPTGETTRIRRNPTRGSDDFAHAVNFAVCALWQMHNAWPDLAVAGRTVHR